MDKADPPSPGVASDEQTPQSPRSPRKLPDDLPTSLNDRRNFPSYTVETEVYDAWHGRSPAFYHLGRTKACLRIIPVHYGTYTLTTGIRSAPRYADLR
jgi:hypothetical protein